MGKGRGTGWPNWFFCTVARRNRDPFTYRYPEGHRKIVRTGRTRPAPSPNKGHPRKLPQSHEYVCECGHRGWTCHIDILRYPVETESVYSAVMSDDKEQVYGPVVMGTHPLRARAREAALVYTDSRFNTGQRGALEHAADAASDVWAPVVQRLFGIVADAYADVDGWKQRANDVVFDQTLNPVVAVYDPEKHEFVDDQDG